MPLDDRALATIAANLVGLRLDPVTHLRVVYVVALIAPKAESANRDGQDKNKPAASRRGANGRFASVGAAHSAAAVAPNEAQSIKTTKEN